jgi:hypothetical protein
MPSGARPATTWQTTGSASCQASPPGATAARVTAVLRLDPVTSRALGRIICAEERASYARAPLPASTLRADNATIRRALSRQATWPELGRARALPTSALAPVKTGLRHALDVSGWLEAAGQRFRGRGIRIPQPPQRGHAPGITWHA